MITAFRCLFFVCVVALLTLAGCKKETPVVGGNTTVSDEDIAAVRDAMTRGMNKTALSSLKATDIGKKCVVTARTPVGGYQSTPPPPPPGMVRLLGQAIIYNGEFDRVSDESVTVRAAYPTAGNYKRIEIPRDDIQSFYLAP